MKNVRRFVLCSVFAFASACGGGGGGGGGGGVTPAPAPPAGAVITLPASSVLPAGAPSVPIQAITFTATGTAPFSWSISGGLIPPGLSLSASGVYSGIPLTSGSFTFTVRVTDANGFATRGFNHVILASVPESEPNNTPGTADLLPDGVTGTGTLVSSDLDYWTFSATADDVIQVELFGTRRDFGAYELAGSIPRLSVIGPDGTSFLVGHDVQAPFQQDIATGWSGGVHDMDIPAFRVPTTGSYFLRIEPDIGSTGAGYAVRVASLLLGSTQSESEPNDDPAGATAINPGTIRGFHADEDLDFYSFTISAPTLVTFEIFSYRNGIGGVAGIADNDYFDPQIVVITPDGLSAVSGNDDVHFYDSKVSCLIGTSGTYFVLVLESDFATAGDSEYLLMYQATAVGSNVESEPNDDPLDAFSIDYSDVVSGFADADAGDIDAFAFAGNAGDMVYVSWYDLGTHEFAADFVDVFIFNDVPEIITQTVSYWGSVGENAIRAILPSSGTYYVVVFPFGANTEYTFQLLLQKEGTFESTSNNTIGSAEPLPFSGSVTGSIPAVGDVDFFSFAAVEGEVVVFSIYAAQPVSPPGSAGYTLNWFSPTGAAELLPDLEIFASNGVSLGVTPAVTPTGFCTGESLANGQATSGIAFIAPSSGTFYIRVASNDGVVSPEGSLYFLERR